MQASPRSARPATTSSRRRPMSRCFPGTSGAARWSAPSGRTPDADLDYGDRHGSSVLRSALAERLGRTRGVVTNPRRLVVVQGFAQGLDVICGTLLASGRRRLAIEDPALSDAVMTARQVGLEIIPVPVDGDGIDVAALARAGADAVLVTPAHQFPTGVVLTPGTPPRTAAVGA